MRFPFEPPCAYPVALARRLPTGRPPGRRFGHRPDRRPGCWPRLARPVLPAGALIVLLGCSALPMAAPGTAAAQERSSAAGEGGAFDGELMYELMIAELAGRRGRLDLATEGYLAASERSADPRVADRAARLAMFARRWPDAERAARRWMSLEPAAAEAHDILGRALLLQGEGEAAAEAYVTRIGMASEAARSETIRELVATLQGDDPERVMRVVEALAEAYPEEAEAHLGIARFALAGNDRERALEAVDAALSADARSVDAQLMRARILLASGRAEEAFERLEAALGEAPDDVRLRLGRAQLLAESGRTEAALAEFATLHEAAPDDADVQLTIGLLALDAGRVEPARRYLEALLETGEYADQANFYLARIEDGEENRREAIARYEAVQPGQLYADARMRAAELFALEGDLERGRSRLRDLAAEYPDPALQPRLLLAEGRMLQRAGNPAEAVTVLSGGLERFPENADLLYARALAADGAGDPDALERDLERLIAMEPDNAHALNALGYHLADADRRLDEAQTLLEKAIELEPDDAAILDSLGWLRYRQGRLDEAVVLLRRALAALPDGEIAAHLGEVLWMQGEREEARAIWERALDRSPDDDVLRRVVRKFID